MVEGALVSIQYNLARIVMAKEIPLKKFKLALEFTLRNASPVHPARAMASYFLKSPSFVRLVEGEDFNPWRLA